MADEAKAAGDDQTRPKDEPEGKRGEPPEEEPESPPMPRYKKVLWAAAAVAVLAAAGVGGFFYWEYAKQYESTDDAFLDAHVVQVDAKVIGYVVGLLVSDNQLVRKGDLLVEIDPRDYQAALDEAKAAEAAAGAKVAQAKTQVDQSEAARQTAEANITAAAAAARRDTAELARFKKLRDTSSISAEEYDTGVASAAASVANEEAARARFGEAVAAVAASKAALAAAQATQEEAAARTRAAEVTLTYTKITAPIAGRVTRRTVETGDLLQPGTSLFALVEPAPWVTANFKETQLTRMRPGQPVTVSVDAYPDRELTATIDSFQRGSGQRFSLLPPENATGNYVKVVQRVPVKIVFDRPPPEDMILGPGMSVVPTVKVQ